MFGVQDIRKSKIWQEAVEIGMVRERKARMKKCLAKGMSDKETAEIMGISVKEGRRLANKASK